LNKGDDGFVKALITIIPVLALCSCGGISTPATFATPEAAAAAQASAAQATGLQAAQLAGLSPAQIAAIQSLPASDIAQLKGLSGTQFMSKLATPNRKRLNWWN